MLRAYNICIENQTIIANNKHSYHCTLTWIARWQRLGKKLEARILKYANTGHRLHKACLGLQRKEKERENAHSFYEGLDYADYDPVIATFSLNAFRPFRFDIGMDLADEYRERLSKHLKEL